jgi:hypothetical protein
MAVAKAGKVAGRAADKPAARRGGSLTWLLGVGCGVAVTFATPSAVLAGVLMAPGVVAAMFDRQANRAVTRVVFISGAGLTFGPLWHLNTGTPSMAAALDLLADPAVLCPAWLAAACGWTMCEALPIVLQMAANRRAAGRIAALREEAAALQAAWDLE